MSDDAIFRKCAWRLMPLVIAAYLVNYIDRVNVGFAALTMNKQLGFSPEVYGFGAGILFVGYALFQLPSNLVLHRIGAKIWIAVILASWGVLSAAGALINGPLSFFIQRVLLGVAEAGLFPGVLLYLTWWFPKAWLCRANAAFMSATGVALIIGGPLASAILTLGGVGGIPGWRWLFLLEGVAPIMLAVAVFILLPNRPEDASWLSADEARQITRRLAREDAHKQNDLSRALRDPRMLLLGFASGCQLFAWIGLALWIPLIVQGLGFAIGATGFVVALIYAATLPVMILWARHSDRHGERVWHAVIPVLVVSIVMAVAALLPENPVVLVLLAAAAIGAAAWFGPYYSLAPLFLSGSALAGGIALMNATANFFGGFCGQYLIGVLRQQSGSYSAPFLMISGVTLLAAVIVLSLGRSVAPRPIAQTVPAE